MNKDIRFLIDFSTRQLMKLEGVRNLSEERRTQVDKEINDEIRDLEEFINTGDMQRKLTGFG